MLATFIGVSVRLWLASTDPDTDVHTSGGSYPDIGEFFVNTTTSALFLCTNNGSPQVWNSTTNMALIQALIASIPQSDWDQTDDEAADYIKNKPSIPDSQIQTDWEQNDSGEVDFIQNKPTIPDAQIQSDWEQVNAGALDFIKNKPAAISQSSVSRSLNTIFQVSATRWSTVRYSVDISSTVSLSGGQVGRVILEMATNSGFTTGVQELQSFGNGNSGTLVIGLVLTQLNTACLSGNIPPGNYVRLRTVNVTGTPTFTYQSGQEVLL